MSKKSLESYENLPSSDCRNCNYSYNGFYCPRCGQRKLEGRYTLSQSFGWIFNQIFNLERGLLFTVKELFVRPGELISSFLNRATVRYSHPFRFVFVMATIAALLTILTGTFEASEVTEYFEKTGEDDIEKRESIKLVIENIKKYLSLLLLINIPFNAVASLIVYSSRKYNYTEHLILNCYAYGFTLIIGLPTHLFLFLPNGLLIEGTAVGIF